MRRTLQRPTLNVQRQCDEAPVFAFGYFSFLMKLMSPLRSSRAIRIFASVFGLGVEAQVFLEIVLGDEIPSHFCRRSISPFRTSVTGRPLMSLPNQCDLTGGEGEEAME